MLLLRLKVFALSLIFHVYHGFPKCTNQQIKDRYEICKNCNEFNSVKSICKVCGCNLGTKKRFLNKLAWADQECPIGKWQKIK
jgi:uncharacterized paraquat-inducible protein A